MTSSSALLPAERKIPLNKRFTSTPFLRSLGTPLLWAIAGGLAAIAAQVQGPLAAKVTVTPLASYSGSLLPKPEKILVYDFAANPDDVQVDKIQALRPRHLITGDNSADAIAKSANKTFSTELVKALAKTGIPVEHAAPGTVPSDHDLVVQGSFVSLKEGHKTERVAIGMGTGSADLEAKVDVRLKTPTENVVLSQFQTETRGAKNLGAGVPMAGGLNPAVAVTKSTVTDRKKTLNSYASKTADEAAKEITKAMAGQGWIKTDDEGKVLQ